MTQSSRLVQNDQFYNVVQIGPLKGRLDDGGRMLEKEVFTLVSVELAQIHARWCAYLDNMMLLTSY